MRQHIIAATLISGVALGIAVVSAPTVGCANPAICRCQFQCDCDQDGVLDVVDMNYLIDVIFFSREDVQDGLCPVTRSDFDANGFADAVDLNGLIDHLFFSGLGPLDPCGPYGTLTDYDGCLQFDTRRDIDTVPLPQYDCIDYIYDQPSRVLYLTHYHAAFNCCPTYLIGTVTSEPGLITITEGENLTDPPGGCECLCLFNTFYTISEVPATEITIQILGMYLYGDPPVTATIDLSDSYQWVGEVCIERSRYPWLY